MQDHQLINQDSGVCEWYTPADIIGRVRNVLDGIDLDPASCFKANRVVRAETFFGHDIDGLSRSWIAGSVWMNHPFSRKGNPIWIDKFISEFEKEHFSQGCAIMYSSTDTDWYQRMAQRFIKCEMGRRTKFWGPSNNKNRPTKGCSIFYAGNDEYKFAGAFEDLGVITVPFSLYRR